MILPIYTLGQPVLRKVAEDIDPQDADIQQFVQDMYDTLDHSGGIGLAAPQVGRSVRVVVIDLNPIKDDYPQYDGYRHVFFNPYIEEYDKSNQETMDEGCLSLPGMSERVKRPTRIRVTYQDEQLQEHDEWVDGYLARVMQHEFDHLDGKVYTDHIQGLRKQMIKSKLNDILKGRFSCDYKVKVKR
ncbi:MAG: peptide deformylase [Bacteroidaceae bacterium]|nr:peptide deformylase [Bacteroidaceae bacterium]